MTAQPELMFYFRLARELGMSVGRLLDECDSREIASWIAYFLVADGKFKEKTPSGMADKFKALMGAQALKDKITGKARKK